MRKGLQCDDRAQAAALALNRDRETRVVEPKEAVSSRADWSLHRADTPLLRLPVSAVKQPVSWQGAYQGPFSVC